MSSIEEIREGRIKKLELLRNAGMEPYPEAVSKTHTLKEVIAEFENFKNKGARISLAGRIMAIRGQGAILFVSLKENTSIFQVVLKKDHMEESIFTLFGKSVDIGDIVSFSGTLFVTQKGENSLLSDEWQMASKSLQPLPDKWHGVEDEELKIRKRYLDIITDEEVFKRFETRSMIISKIREFMNKNNYMEVETPILQNQAGGANAKVFETHHNALDQDMVLRIALELDHKILMAAGYSKIYEIGKIFRNEGMDATHLQEFTMMEAYSAFETLEENMNWVEELIKELAKEVVGKDIYEIKNSEDKVVKIDLLGSWDRVRFDDLLREYADLDPLKASDKEIMSKAKEIGVEDLKSGTANILDQIYKKTARKELIKPTFVTNYPSSLKPLAKPLLDGSGIVASLVIAGAEITNQYGELNDPITQRRLLEEQSKAKKKGDDEAMEVDERFLEAMEYGMPPMAGMGIGIDRLTAILTEQYNLRNTIFFPTIKQK